jgi:hypothetical protein
MTILTRLIEQIAALLLATGITAGQATLYALILIYLLVSGLIAGFLIFILVRRRQRRQKSLLPPSDLES